MQQILVNATNSDKLSQKCHFFSHPRIIIVIQQQNINDRYTFKFGRDRQVTKVISWHTLCLHLITPTPVSAHLGLIFLPKALQLSLSDGSKSFHHSRLFNCHPSIKCSSGSYSTVLFTSRPSVTFGPKCYFTHPLSSPPLKRFIYFFIWIPIKTFTATHLSAWVTFQYCYVHLSIFFSFPLEGKNCSAETRGSCSFELFRRLKTLAV